MIIYVATPPGHSKGCRHNNYILVFHTLAEAQQYIKDQYPVDIKNSLPPVDWKTDWITTIDTEVDLA